MTCPSLLLFNKLAAIIPGSLVCLIFYSKLFLDFFFFPIIWWIGFLSVVCSLSWGGLMDSFCRNSVVQGQLLVTGLMWMVVGDAKGLNTNKGNNKLLLCVAGYYKAFFKIRVMILLQIVAVKRHRRSLWHWEGHVGKSHHLFFPPTWILIGFR